MGLNRLPLWAKIGVLVGLLLLFVAGLWLRPQAFAAYHFRMGERMLERALRPVYSDRLAPERVLDTAALEVGIRHLEAAIRWGMDDPHPFQFLARAYLSLNQPEQALDMLQRALQIWPEEISLHLDLADVYDSLGHTEEAIREYERGGIGTRRLPLAANYLKLAEAQVEYGGNDELAIRLWLRTLQVDPGNLCALYSLYVVHRKIGDTITAAQYQEQLKMRGPNVPLPMDFRLAECQAQAMAGLVEWGLWERRMLLEVLSSHVWEVSDELSARMAERELHTLLAQRPEDPDLLFLLGELYHRRGDLKRAEGAYREVIRVAPGYTPAYWRLNIIREGSGNE